MNDFKENITNKIEAGKSSAVEGLKNLTKLDDKNLLNNLPLLLFAAVLGIVHVANNHLVEYKIRKINKMEKEIKELRWNYMTTKSELMFQSKQSEVAKTVQHLGLKEITIPPYKIEVESDEYE